MSKPWELWLMNTCYCQIMQCDCRSKTCDIYLIKIQILVELKGSLQKMLQQFCIFISLGPSLLKWLTQLLLDNPEKKYHQNRFHKKTEGNTHIVQVMPKSKISCYLLCQHKPILQQTIILLYFSNKFTQLLLQY